MSSRKVASNLFYFPTNNIWGHLFPIQWAGTRMDIWSFMAGSSSEWLQFMLYWLLKYFGGEK